MTSALLLPQSMVKFVLIGAFVSDSCVTRDVVLGYLSEIIASVFRPGVAALALAVGASVILADSEVTSYKSYTVNAMDLSCSGLLRPVCSAFDS